MVGAGVSNHTRKGRQYVMVDTNGQDRRRQGASAFAAAMFDESLADDRRTAAEVGDRETCGLGCLAKCNRLAGRIAARGRSARHRGDCELTQKFTRRTIVPRIGRTGLRRFRIVIIAHRMIARVVFVLVMRMSMVVELQSTDSPAVRMCRNDQQRLDGNNADQDNSDRFVECGSHDGFGPGCNW